MRRLLAVAGVSALAVGLLFTTTAASADLGQPATVASAVPSDAPPPLASTTTVPVPVIGKQATAQAQTANATIGWSVYFGTGYNYAPVVYSNRNPTWVVDAGNPYLTFQPDCNFVIYSTSGGGAFWASNSVAQLRPCTMTWQNNADVVMRNSAGQIGWHTNILHTGIVYAAMALYDSGCLVEYYNQNGHWVNVWRTNLTGIGINCASYTA